jgi:hypothetical protein
MSLFAVELMAALQQKVRPRDLPIHAALQHELLLNRGVEMTNDERGTVDPRVRL